MYGISESAFSVCVCPCFQCRSHPQWTRWGRLGKLMRTEVWRGWEAAAKNPIRSEDGLFGCGLVAPLSLFRVCGRLGFCVLGDAMKGEGAHCSFRSIPLLPRPRAVHEQRCKSHYGSNRARGAFVSPWHSQCFAVRLWLITKPFKIELILTVVPLDF